jgi:hypothetical protein
VTKNDVKSRLKYVSSDLIATLDIDNPKFTIVSGAKISDTKVLIKYLYPGRIKVPSHEYVNNGYYLT